MKRIIFLISACLILNVYSQNWRSKWDRSGSNWSEKWTNTLNSLNQFSEEEQFQILATAVRSGAFKRDQEQQAISDRARTVLLGTPGFAEHFRDRILEAKAARAAADGTMEYSAKANDFMTELNDSLMTLSQLPSPETVKVMGEFLFDDSVNPYPIQDKMREDPLSFTAVRHMAKLPLESKPADTLHDHEAGRDLDSWRQWYKELKSGKRTFRFKGDPTEYDLSGPASNQQIARTSRDLKQVPGSRRSSGSSVIVEDAAANESSKSLTIALLIAAMLLLTSLGWYCLRKRDRIGSRS